MSSRHEPRVLPTNSVRNWLANRDRCSWPSVNARRLIFAVDTLSPASTLQTDSQRTAPRTPVRISCATSIALSRAERLRDNPEPATFHVVVNSPHANGGERLVMISAVLPRQKTGGPLPANGNPEPHCEQQSVRFCEFLARKLDFIGANILNHVRHLCRAAQNGRKTSMNAQQSRKA